MDDNLKRLSTDLHAKWGDIIIGTNGGWTAIPNLMLKKQGELGLKAIELVVVINLVRFWWEPENLPFPDLEKMAIEMGTSGRTIYRAITSLEEKGFIEKIQLEGKPTKYDLAGLLERLKEIKNAV